MAPDKDKRTAPQNRNDNAERGTGAYEQKPQRRSKVLGTDKSSNFTTPLHGSLSEQPEVENKAVKNNNDIGKE
ncbi:MAG TPA: hypothetical protein VGC22_12780 [Chitinophaga sp.]